MKGKETIQAPSSQEPFATIEVREIGWARKETPHSSGEGRNDGRDLVYQRNLEPDEEIPIFSQAEPPIRAKLIRQDHTPLVKLNAGRNAYFLQGGLMEVGSVVIPPGKSANIRPNTLKPSKIHNSRVSHLRTTHTQEPDSETPTTARPAQTGQPNSPSQTV